MHLTSFDHHFTWVKNMHLRYKIHCSADILYITDVFHLAALRGRYDSNCPAFGFPRIFKLLQLGWIPTASERYFFVKMEETPWRSPGAMPSVALVWWMATFRRRTRKISLREFSYWKLPCIVSFFHSKLAFSIAIVNVYQRVARRACSATHPSEKGRFLLGEPTRWGRWRWWT